MALLDDRGRTLETGAHVTGVVFAGEAPAFALGDGTVRFVGDTDERVFEVHDGACLAVVGHPDGLSLLTGGDDGRLARTNSATGPETVTEMPGKWIDRLAAGPSGAIAWASGKRAWALVEGKEYTFEATSSVGGLGFAPKGLRLAIAHYGGVTLHWLGAGGEPTTLVWKGAHQAVSWSADARFVVTAMQENALHGWRLPERTDLKMTGYPAKIRSMAWTPKGRWLATSGADGVIVWPFQGKDGPMGKSARQVGMRPQIVTAVAAHPKHDVIAAGYDDGLVMLIKLDDGEELLAAKPGGGAVSGMAWHPAGDRLAFGTEEGRIGVLGI